MLDDAAIYFDFSRSLDDLTGQGRPLQLRGARWEAGKPLAFSTHLQLAEVDPEGMRHLSRRLHGIRSATIGAWVLPRRAGEQLFLFRGVPEIAPGGERLFRPSDRYVNFLLGTDQHGFLMGAINGNGRMPFPHVTLNELRINHWHQIVLVKDEAGYQRFYVNGTLVHSDEELVAAGQAWPFREVEPESAEPLRLSVPLGGEIGEAWVCPRALAAEEIRADYEAKRERYRPAPPGVPVALREMNAHFPPDIWREPPTEASWPAERRRILAAMREVFGAPPAEKPPLAPEVVSEVDCGRYVRRKVVLTVQPGDRMPAYLLVPKRQRGRVPAIVCFYGTTGGAGKETTVGLSGGRPGSPPEKNRGFAVDMAEAGFVAFAADYLRDGERVEPGMRPYDTTRFYEQFPEWSIHGKDAWDTSRAIDYLQTLPFVDGERIGMVGHSYGGHSTLFTTALEPRIRAAVANGPVSSFWDHGMHWGVPKGAGNSQSLPHLRPYLLERRWPLPLEFHEVCALAAPRPLLVGQAVGERRPREEETYGAVRQLYQALGHPERVRYHWYAGDHDFPPVARQAAVEWLRRWLLRT
ncbi:MAG: alpha/beta hydrolase family protein [Armatimonadota bacterium]